MSSFFISYARADRKRIESLVWDLHNLGHNVWIDGRQISAGQIWWQEICSGIRSTDYFIFVLSASSARSMICAAEYSYAESIAKHIIPIRIDRRVDPSRTPSVVAKRHLVDYDYFKQAGVSTLSIALAALPPTTAVDVAVYPTPDAPVVTSAAFGQSELRSISWYSRVIHILVIIFYLVTTALPVGLAVGYWIGIIVTDGNTSHVGWTYAITAGIIFVFLAGLPAVNRLASKVTSRAQRWSDANQLRRLTRDA